MNNKILLTGIACFSAASALFGQTAQQSRQIPLAYFGAQIGNELATTSIGCSIGTAGSLVTDGTNDYILSNSHVLAREGVGVVGENIMHTVSTACSNNALHVGELAADVPLSFSRKRANRVDAAVARITPNVQPATDNSGRILHIGNNIDFTDAYAVSAQTVTAALGRAVKKSGRTTGLTHSSIGFVGVNINVSYDGGRAYFTDQFVVSGGDFSAGGDSGSLIVTDDASANPVGLLFAGSSTDTIANPIDIVLEQLSGALGLNNTSLRFGTSGDLGTFDLAAPTGGGGGGKSDKPTRGGKRSTSIQQASITQALAVRNRNEARLHGYDGILGSGIGIGPGNVANITVFVNKANSSAKRHLPKNLEGVNVEVRLSEEFYAY
ncbi:MAG: hypothetical protein ABS34_07485 [Opitutaceae bacterium BACL24 MAG-120322-bin51]|nr:MAG: hypothetical protein ABS34_07485 [Opitutaceae bacterium BACL24 MAG-120322-bin51]